MTHHQRLQALGDHMVGKVSKLLRLAGSGFLKSTGWMLRSSSAPIYFLIFPYLFSHMTLCHMVHHLTCHLTFITWPSYCSDHLIVHSPLSASLGDAYCSTFYCPLSPLSPPYCLDPHCSLGPIVCPFWMLSQVAASVVYKPCLYHRGGLKPDLVYSIQVLLLSPAQLCAFILIYLLSLWIISRSLETLPPNTLFPPRHSSWGYSSRHYCYH